MVTTAQNQTRLTFANTCDTVVSILAFLRARVTSVLSSLAQVLVGRLARESITGPEWSIAFAAVRSTCIRAIRVLVARRTLAFVNVIAAVNMTWKVKEND